MFLIDTLSIKYFKYLTLCQAFIISKLQKKSKRGGLDKFFSYAEEEKKNTFMFYCMTIVFKQTVNVAPCPGLLSTVIEPPTSSTVFFTSARPRPFPS